jgi:hypothetical protein
MAEEFTELSQYRDTPLAQSLSVFEDWILGDTGPAFNAKVLVSGQWKAVSAISVLVSGVWKTVTSGKVLIGGAWKNF